MIPLTLPTPAQIDEDAAALRAAAVRNNLTGGAYADIDSFDRLAAAARLVPDLNALPALVADEWRHRIAEFGDGSVKVPTIEDALVAVLARRAA